MAYSWGWKLVIKEHIMESSQAKNRHGHGYKTTQIKFKVPELLDLLNEKSSFEEHGTMYVM